MSDNRTLSRMSVLVGRAEVEIPAPNDAFGLHIQPDTARRSLRLSEADAFQLGSIAGFEIAQPINSVTGADHRSIRLGPDEWLLVARKEQRDFDAALAQAIGQYRHALTDVSHRSIAVDVTGSRARDVLSTGCLLDLDPRMFPVGYATRTLFAKTEVIISRSGDGSSLTVECWRSFARYMLSFMIDAARLQGIR